MNGHNSPALNRHHPTNTLRTAALTLFLLVLSFQFLGIASASSPYEKSNAGIPNFQASSPTTGGATNDAGNCVNNAAYNNHHSESWIAVDPTNPSHLVAMSKFFFEPEFYLFHLGSYVSNNGGTSWTNEIVPGFDCQSAPSNSWVDTTDPILAFDSKGNIYSVILPFSFSYNTQQHQVWNVVPNDAVAVVKSVDGGNTWTIANQGQALAVYQSGGLGVTADKQWLAIDTNPASPNLDNVYAAWTVFDGLGSEIWFSRSTDHGAHFSTPVQLSFANNDGPFNTFVFPGTAPDGTLYLAYDSFPNNKAPQVDVFLLKSTDGGATFSSPSLAVAFNDFPFAALPNTTFRDGISNSFAVNPANGHLLLALEVYNGAGIDVQLAESTNGGNSWSTPIYVNDPSTVNDGMDQFQPTVAAAPNGIVAVAFYDRRLPCPTNDPNILSQDAGRTNFCINTSIQFYTDGASGLQALGSNTRLTKATWDPQNPGTTTGQLPRTGGPTGFLTFIGDYFGLTLTNQNAYAFFVSTYNLGQNPTNDQQQFLAVVSIPNH